MELEGKSRGRPLVRPLALGNGMGKTGGRGRNKEWGGKVKPRGPVGREQGGKKRVRREGSEEGKGEKGNWKKGQRG